MGTGISVAAGGPSTGVRSFPWPVLQRGDTSFPGGAYAVEVELAQDRCGFKLTHRIQGAPLILRLLAERRAQYVCSVSSANASYRHVATSTEPTHRIHWDRDDLGAPPIFVPMVVSREEYRCTFDAQRDGIADLWHGKTITVPKGAKLALGPSFQLQSSLLQLLTFKLDDHLESGQFEVKPNTKDGFRFDVHLARDLFTFLEYQRDLDFRGNIMTHIVGAALALLQRDYATDDDDEGWRTYSNLKAFAEHLQELGMPLWDERDFSPERVATALYPHRLPSVEEEDE